MVVRQKHGLTTPEFAAKAAQFGVHQSTLHRHCKLGFPLTRETTKAEYDAWKAGHLRPKPGAAVVLEAGPATVAEPSANGHAPEEALLVQRLRAEIHKLRSDATGKDLRNQKLAGETVSRGDVLRVISELCIRVKLRLESVPQEMISELPPDLGPEICRVWGGKVRLILGEMERMEIMFGQTAAECIKAYAAQLE